MYLESIKKDLDEIKSSDQTVDIYAVDLSRPDEIEALIKSIEDVDVLVNNAGITIDGLLMRMKDEDWTDVIATNLTSAFRLTKGVIRGMMKRKNGRIINISSVVGVRGNAGQTNYAASKAGLIGFTKSLAKEVASKGVTINAVAPGYIETQMTQELTEKQKLAVKEQIPLKRLGKVDDIAEVVLFLASEQASYITGQVISVDGGMNI